MNCVGGKPSTALRTLAFSATVCRGTIHAEPKPVIVVEGIVALSNDVCAT